MGTVTIPLTQGKVCLIDAEDEARARLHRWHAVKGNTTWYVATNVKRPDGHYTTLLLHRLILDAPPAVEVDHKSGNGLDNRRANLRLTPRNENKQNRARGRNSTCGYKGVSFRKERGIWVARVLCNGVHHYAGSYATPEEAARAYDAKAREVFGAFARLNFPD